jgi:hypothetical protein
MPIYKNALTARPANMLAYQDSVSATPRNEYLGALADWLAQSYSPERTQQMQGVAQFFGAPAVSQTLDRLSYGEPLTTGRGMTTQVRPEVLEAAMTVAPMAKPVTMATLEAARQARRAALAGGRAVGEEMAARMLSGQSTIPGLPASVAPSPVKFATPPQNALRPIQQQADLSYRGSHTAPGPDFGAPLYDLTGGGQMYPADVYSSKAVQYYGTGNPKADREAFALAHRLRGQPDAEVTMYRAVPKDEKITAINPGDWVTLSKDYAQTHGDAVLDGNYKILSQKVKAKELWTHADSIQEFGYQPQNP